MVRLRTSMVVGLVVIAIAVACEPADIEGTPLAGRWSPVVAVDALDPETCEGPKKLEAMAPATLPACCDGTAHCVPKDKVPGSRRRSLEECPGGYCIPDTIIRSGGAPSPRCKAFDGSEGACVSTCVPRAGEAKDVLQKDSCTGAGELCAPCISPIDKLSTGVCEVGTEKAEVDCSKDAAAPPCNPPPTCTSLAGAEGRCLNVSIPDVAAKKDSLPQASCAVDERCAPCFDPLDGKSTDACNQSCDPGPTKPAVVFPACCSLEGSPKGHCVPNDAIPDALEKSLSKKDCASDDTRCVPDENAQVGFAPPACNAASPIYIASGGGYNGVCLSKCIEFKGINGLIVKQGTCDALHNCVPCADPLGKATGAPGCK